MLQRPSALGLLLATAASAQIVVDPGGGGHYTDLQTALNAAPSGAVIKVVGGAWGPIAIRRSVTLLGAPAPWISAPISGSGQQPPAITISGTGTESVTLDNVRAFGRTDGATWNFAGPALAASAVARLSILHSALEAPSWFYITGDAASVPGLLANGVANLLVVDSDVRANPSLTDGWSRWGHPGARGIEAPGATVVLMAANVAGGDGPDTYWPFGPPAPSPCPCPGGGAMGGDAINAARVIAWHSTLRPGRGGAVFVSTTGGPPFLAWGRQPDGQALASGVPGDVRPFGLVASGPMRLGGLWELFIDEPTRLVAGILVVTPAPAAPLPIRPGLWTYLDPATILLTDFVPVTTRAVRLPIPADPSLLGVGFAADVVYAQLVLATIGPLADVVGY